MSKRFPFFPKVSHAALNRLQVSLVLVAGLAAIIGCSKAAYYREYVPSMADVSGIERVAVAEFKGLERSGRIVAAKISEGIVNAGHFRLLEREEIDRILEEREFNESGWVDPATISDLKLWGVDGLIFGVVDAYNIDSQTGVERVEREVGTGRYREVEREGEGGETEIILEEIKETILVDRGYILREGTMAVTFRLANINTGEIVAIKTETAHFSKRCWRDEPHSLPSKDMILDHLSRDVAARFLQQMHPRWVSHRVTFEENEAPSTEIGISYAQSNLWDKAYGALRMATREMPHDATTHYNLAVVADVLGMQEEALQSIERAIALDPQQKYMRYLAHMRHRDQLSAKP